MAASFVTLPPAAKLAFLVLGPMLDLKLYLMYTRVFRPRLIWTIIPRGGRRWCSLCSVAGPLICGRYYGLVSAAAAGSLTPSPDPAAPNS